MGDITVGGTPIVSRRYGVTEVLKVMVSDEQIWPPKQLVDVIGSLIYTTNMGAFPTHQAGDLLVVVASAAGSTPPTLPAGFFSAYISPSTEFSMAVRVGYKFAIAAGTSCPPWTGAVALTTVVFRGVNTTTPFGAIDSKNTASNTVGQAPGLTLTNATGTSTVWQTFINNGTAGSLGANTQPAGWQMKNRNARVINNCKIDSRSVLPTSETLVGGGSVNWRGTVFEILPADLAAADSGGVDTEVAAAAVSTGTIKGNADSGLYHMPDSAHYAETIAEEWFDTEAQAKAAGYTKAP